MVVLTRGFLLYLACTPVFTTSIIGAYQTSAQSSLPSLDETRTHSYPRVLFVSLGKGAIG